MPLKPFVIRYSSRDKNLRWYGIFSSAWAAMDAALAQCQSLSSGAPFGLSVIHLKEKTPCATATA